MSQRGQATREHLLDVAERLFAETGVFRTSLRSIRIAAGEKNTAAVHHYFVDREGVVHALTERHVPRLAARQQAMWDDLVARDALGDARQLVELLVRPCAEYLALGPSERAWVVIMAELGSRPDLLWREVVDLTPGPAVDVGRALTQMMAKIVDPAIARERMFVGARMAMNVCADRARRIDDPEGRGEALPQEIFIDNLSNMLCAALLAPLAR